MEKAELDLVLGPPLPLLFVRMFLQPTVTGHDLPAKEHTDWDRTQSLLVILHGVLKGD